MRVIYFLFSILLSLNIYAAITDLDKALIGVENVSPNGGVESGKAGFSANGGTSAIAIETTNKLSGKAAIKFTSSGATDYLATSAYAVKHGPNAMMSFYYKSTSAAFVAEVMEGSNVVATLALPANTAFQLAELSFVAKDATTVYHLHVRGGAAASIIYVDDLYQGKNLNIGSVNLADKEYNLLTACSGSSCLSANNSFVVTVAKGVPYKDRNGNWRLRFNLQLGNGSAVQQCVITFTGATFTETLSIDAASWGAYLANSFTGYSNGGASQLIVSSGANFTYFTTSGDVPLNSKPTWATDYAAEQVVRAENATNNVLAYRSVAQTLTADSSTEIAFDSLSGTDSQSSLNPSNGRFTAKISGKYLVSYAVFILTGGTAPANIDSGIKINGAGSMFGYGYNNVLAANKYYSLTGQAIISLNANEYVSVFSSSATQGATVYGGATLATYANFSLITPTVAMPQIIQSVGTSYQGVTRLESVQTGYSGSTATVCSGSPCELYYNTGGISSITRIGAGQYNVNFNVGTFSTIPNCTCNTRTAGSDWICLVRPSSSTLVNIITENLSGGATDGTFNIICHGIK